MIDLQAFPPEILVRIVEFLVVTVGVYKSVRYRLVNKTFDGYVQSAICNPQVIDLFDHMAPYLERDMPHALKGRALLRRAQTRRALGREYAGLYAIRSVNQALDGLTQAGSEERIKHHRMVAEEVARHYGSAWREPMRPCGIDEQMIFCGAIIIGNLPLVKNFLENGGAAVNEYIPYFGRPLSLAAGWGHLDIVRYLLAGGADPRAMNDDEPAEWNRDWTSNMDLMVGIPCQAKLTDGSPLRAAVLGGHEETVELLLSPKYRVRTPSAEFFRVMVAAANTGNMDLLQRLNSALVETTEKSWPEYEGVGACLLIEAARYGHIRIVEVVLDHGISVNAQRNIPYQPGCMNGNYTALGHALARGNVDMVRLLLNRGANMDLQDPFSIGVLQIAMMGGHAEVLDLPIAAAALEESRHVRASIFNAVEHGQLHLVKRLIERYPHGIEGYEGVYILGMAIKYRNPAVISALVEGGVPLNGHEPEEDCLVAAARDTGAQWVVDYLLSIGAEDCVCVGNPKRVKIEDESDEKNLPIRGGVRVTRRTWEWLGKY